MAKENRYYLAYGSNLNLNQMLTRCPNSKKVGTALLENYRLMFKRSQTGYYLTIEKANGFKVPIGVFLVDEYDERSLDRYEGFPKWYQKIGIKVELIDNDGNKRLIDAFYYALPETKPHGAPSDEYVKRVEKGYQDFGFDSSLLYEALEYSKNNN